jgi:hypothetical protein
MESEMPRRVTFIAAIMLFGVCGAALAHHGWGSYDASKLITVDSAVTSLEWQNPHVHLAVTYAGESWDVVLAPPFRMEVRGLSPAMIKPGTHIRAEGYASRRVPREMRAERLVADGKTYEMR